ncbi:MAG: transposase family protein [Elusimicrobia bacterium]|nr:transposase family protein [Elusimicrobiota bacterium]
MCAPACRPNDVWATDFKGWFRTRDGGRVDPLTITDLASRYLIECRALTSTTGDNVRPWFEAAFREFGLPWAIRSDNGPPFASVGLGGLSRLSVWWIRLRIIPERIRPGHPEENGCHERMHRSLAEATVNPPEKTAWRNKDRFAFSERSSMTSGPMNLWEWQRPLGFIVRRKEPIR